MERRRIEAVEAFDEYEEWHLKCSHYILLMAFTGNCCKLSSHVWTADPISSVVLPTGPVKCASRADCFTGMLLVSESLTGNEKLESQTVATDCVNTETLTLDALKRGSYSGEAHQSEWCQRFGHASCLLQSSPDHQSWLVTVGGFGQRDGKHRRLRHIDVRRLDDSLDAQLSCILHGDSETLLERLHHTATSIGGDRILLYGGRTSPAKTPADTCILEVNTCNGSNCGTPNPNKLDAKVCCVKMSGSEEPCRRWRHSATFVQCDGKHHPSYCK